MLLDLSGSSVHLLLHQSELLQAAATILLSDDGRQALVVSKARRLIRLDLSREESCPVVVDLAYAPSTAMLLGNRLLIHDLSTATVALLDIETLGTISAIDVSAVGTVSAMQASVERDILLVGSRAGHVAIYGLSKGQLVASHRISSVAITSVDCGSNSFEAAASDGRHFRFRLVGDRIRATLASVIGRGDTHVSEIIDSSDRTAARDRRHTYAGGLAGR